MSITGGITARAAVVREFGEKLQVEQVTVPELDAGAALAAVDAATVCGTDVHIWRRPGMGEVPFVPGHEVAGTLLDVRGTRTDVTGSPVEPGDRVVWTYPFCGRCFACTVARRPTLCRNSVRFGRTPIDRFPHLLGAFATHHYVPPGSQLVRVPEEVSPELAASASCALRTVMHAFERLGRIGPEETVLVQGAGAVGLYATAVAAAAGARAVLVVGDPTERLELARRFGATDVISISSTTAEERIDWVRSQTGDFGADVVVQCAVSDAIPEGLDLVRDGGRFLSVGAGGSTSLTVPAKVFHERMVDILGVRSGEARHYHAALQFLRGRSEIAGLMLAERRFGLHEATEALDAVASLELVKPVIDPHLV